MATVDESLSKLDEAKDFLRTILADGKRVPAKEVVEIATRRGIRRTTLRAAFEEIADHRRLTPPGARYATSHWLLLKPRQKTSARTANAEFERGFLEALSRAEHAFAAVIGRHNKIGSTAWKKLTAEVRVELNRLGQSIRDKQLK